MFTHLVFLLQIIILNISKVSLKKIECFDKVDDFDRCYGYNVENCDDYHDYDACFGCGHSFEPADISKTKSK